MSSSNLVVIRTEVECVEKAGDGAEFNSSKWKVRLPPEKSISSRADCAWSSLNGPPELPLSKNWAQRRMSSFMKAPLALGVSQAPMRAYDSAKVGVREKLNGGRSELPHVAY